MRMLHRLVTLHSWKEEDMGEDDKVNILLVDDDPAKLLSYEVILSALGENRLLPISVRDI